MPLPPLYGGLARRPNFNPSAPIWGKVCTRTRAIGFLRWAAAGSLRDVILATRPIVGSDGIADILRRRRPRDARWCLTDIAGRSIGRFSVRSDVDAADGRRSVRHTAASPDVWNTLLARALFAQVAMLTPMRNHHYAPPMGGASLAIHPQATAQPEEVFARRRPTTIARGCISDGRSSILRSACALSRKTAIWRRISGGFL